MPIFDTVRDLIKSCGCADEFSDNTVIACVDEFKKSRQRFSPNGSRLLRVDLYNRVLRQFELSKGARLYLDEFVDTRLEIVCR